MKIAIIGTGNVGGGLSTAATRAGHDVVVAASGPASAAKTAADTGGTAAAGNAEAVQGADAGGLRHARSLEEMALLNISLNAANGWTWQSHFALVGPTA